MRMPADSVILTSANAVSLGLVHLMVLTKVGCCELGSPANSLSWVVCPLLFLFTVVYGIKDLFRRGARLQGMLALLLAIPTWILIAQLLRW